MQKQYTFEFSGTKEMFLDVLNKFQNNSNQYYYFDDYIVDNRDGEIRFGVQRAGHSGGYWFLPTITEYDGKTIFTGEMQYIDSYTNQEGTKKLINKIENIFFYILVMPIILIAIPILIVLWLKRKIFKKAEPKTTEECLFDLMERHLKCVRK